MTDKTIAQLKEHADLIGVTYTSKIKKADLIALIEQREQEITSESLARGIADVQAGRVSPLTLPILPSKKGLKGLVNGKVMGTHYRGRAMGAKHYALMREAMAATQAGA